MKTFDEYYWHQFDVLNKDTQLARQFGQDVWDYKQAEIDELKERKEFRDLSQDLAIKNIKDGYEKKIASLAKTITKMDLEIDELQKRIDLTLAAVWNNKCSHTIIDILKGATP